MIELRKWIIQVNVFFWMMSAVAFGAPPDPWIRMTEPNGCSGGVIHASTEYGIWIATCRHCVAQPGREVKLRFFKDGYTSGPFTGYCLASHPKYDCSIVVVPPDNYPYPDLPGVVPLSARGAYVGETVFAIGSFASGTVAPVARKVAVLGFRSDGHELQINESSWGGHSGGAVVSAESGELIGVLWGTGKGYSSVTTSRAIIETLQIAERRGQAMASVPSERPVSTDEKAVATRPIIEVYGKTEALSGWYSELSTDPRMGRFDWQHQSSGKRVRFIWRSPSGQSWHVDGWPGYDKFVGRMLRCRGFPKDAPGSVQWGPFRGDGRSPKNPNSWTIPPNIIGSRGTDHQAEIDKLIKQIEDLIDEKRQDKRDAEDELRSLRLKAEDELRQLNRDIEERDRMMSRYPRVDYDDSPPPYLPETTSEDGHPLAIAADWIKKAREREKEVIEFATSISQTYSQQEPEEDSDELPPWIPWAITTGVAGIAGGSVYRGRKKVPDGSK